MACYADLGLAMKDYDVQKAGEMCGTPGYVDPEVLSGGMFSNRSDIFSLGCVMYNMLTCRVLFGALNLKQVLNKNRWFDGGKKVDEYCMSFSKNCRDLIKMMLVQAQKIRPSAEECLRHPWFSDQKKIIQRLLQANVKYTRSPIKMHYVKPQAFNSQI